MSLSSEQRADIVMLGEVDWRSRASRERSHSSIAQLQAEATRRVNLRAFDSLVEGMRVARGRNARIEDLRDAARSAIAEFPIPLLGPGMLRIHAALEDGNDRIANLLEIIMVTQKVFSVHPSQNPVNALCSAFLILTGDSFATTRSRILLASRECEIYSPELVLMLEGWVPLG